MLTSPPRSLLLGAEHPRVELRPPAEYTLGPEAAELAARAGLVLERWQADGLDLMLSVRPDGKWACFEYGEICARQNGKTALFFARALAGLFLLGEQLIMWSAHEYKTAVESFLQVRDLIANLGVEVKPNVIVIDEGDGGTITVKVSNTNGEEGFTLTSRAAGSTKIRRRQRLRFIARSKGSGRGFSGDVVIVDEAFAYTPAQQSALMPTMNARPNPQVCYASSPPLDSDSGEVLFALRKRVEAGGDSSLGWRDWGETGDLDALMLLPDTQRAEFLDDRARWARTNPAVGRGRVDEESILRNRRAMRDQDFAREIAGIWPLAPEEGGRVIRAADWNALADPESVLGGDPVFAVEANPERTVGAIVAGGRNQVALGHIEVVEHRPGLGLSWMLPRIFELDETHKPEAWLIAADGPAGSLVQEMELAGLPVRALTGREWAQSCTNFYDAVHAPEKQLVHLGDDVLAAAVSAGRKRDIGDGTWSWGRVNSEADITTLCGATLVWHGMPAHYDVLESVY